MTPFPLQKRNVSARITTYIRWLHELQIGRTVGFEQSNLLRVPTSSAGPVVLHLGRLRNFLDSTVRDKLLQQQVTTFCRMSNKADS
jgi:hypothetical protein